VSRRRLAAQGHRVVAVEPTNVFREFGAVHHRSSLIEWMNDALPRLEQLTDRRDEFGLVMLTAVWMHLDEQERRQETRTDRLLPRRLVH